MAARHGGSVVVGEKRKMHVPDLDKELKRLNRIPPPDFSLCELHAIFSFIGRRGSGKTYSAVQLALMLKAERAVNRIFVVSPTCSNNHVSLSLPAPRHTHMYRKHRAEGGSVVVTRPQIFTLLDLKEGDVYPDVLKGYAAIEDIKVKIQQMSDEWEKELVYATAWECWRANKQPVNVTQRELLEQENYRTPDVEGKRPKCLLIFDDESYSHICVMFRRLLTSSSFAAAHRCRTPNSSRLREPTHLFHSCCAIATRLRWVTYRTRFRLFGGFRHGEFPRFGAQLLFECRGFIFGFKCDRPGLAVFVATADEPPPLAKRHATRRRLARDRKAMMFEQLHHAARHPAQIGCAVIQSVSVHIVNALVHVRTRICHIRFRDGACDPPL
jgi:hypothetical protein